MPELPEAETIARDLRSRITGFRVDRVQVHRGEVVDPMSPEEFTRRIRGRTIDRVGRRAKWIVAELDDGSRWVTQLRMTGRFTWSPAGPIREEPHLSMSLLLGSESERGLLRFYDVRRFARMRLLEPDAWADLDARLGPEPLEPDFTPDRFAARVNGSRAPIRNVLLDQARIAGIGNVYANEACFLAGIDPGRPAAGLDEAELADLHGAIREVLRQAIAGRGTSFADFRDVGGDLGSFQGRLAVYGRTGEPCPACGSPIERTVLAGRSAFRCPTCQAR